jgi:hypothetical protein
MPDEDQLDAAGGGLLLPGVTEAATRLERSRAMTAMEREHALPRKAGPLRHQAVGPMASTLRWW